jgi:hypothetical protein
VIREVHKPLRVQAQEVLDRLKNARLLKSWPELQMRIMQLARGGSPPPGLGPPQAELSRNSNQVAFARIRRFESDMPSQPVQSLGCAGPQSKGMPRWSGVRPIPRSDWV